MKSRATLPYRERLRLAIHEIGSPLCVGIDPDLEGLSGFRQFALMRDGVEAYLRNFGEAILAAADGLAPAVKLQSAYFEAAGAGGLTVMADLIASAHRRKMLVILDAKRGDIADTMRAYGRTAFDVFGADALTVTPYMGLDVALPLAPWLVAGRGLYVVWVTSNQAGAALQNAVLKSGQTVAAHVLTTFKDGLASVGCDKAWGLVYGATKAEAMTESLAASLAERPLLIPGIGAQGGKLSGALRRLVHEGRLSLVNVSRGLLPHETANEASWRWADFSAAVHQQVKRQVSALVAEEDLSPQR